MNTYRDEQGDTFPPPEADALEQRQNAVDYGPPDRVSGDVDPEASEADLAEQGALPGGTLDDATPLPADANPADALEQRQEIPTRDEGRRT
ncbi:hypothetical protein JOD64_004761 [Micromonospora luteifusca]|uniref:DUF5709 domain-containing protein n=1 Tax=Micromonospora luteifusca TaxID=709860 RepID=A0ABS2M076_9ACTN|nr:hypothetical protein [Micromonospora luteifusca]MBM7493539.1 hypothetical protein [Micromonospora luteifusca]